MARRMVYGPGALIGIAALLLACAQSSPGNQALPAAVGQPTAHARDIRVLDNPGFVVGYDLKRRRAAWVAFQLRPVGHSQPMQRPDFKPDSRLASKRQRTHYDKRGFDRGHMAPNYAMRQLYGRQAQRASFYYSNVVVQRSRLNQLVWQRLEEIEIDDLAPQLDALWVVTGPVPADNGGLPNAFYRIWLARGSSGQWRTLAFIVPQSVRGDERLSRFRVSIDRIESATGLEFFPKLDHKTQQRLEIDRAPASTFGFARHACQPARYRSKWQGRGGIHLNFDRCDDR
ncbi:DNA/RNA non-specific endonuclease [Salinisphaera orenii]|uniref:DNA/RNA non-specific endonuclease n=1 Tax=Salinisphaera orenii TaxID=856731 RepID=UPI0013A6069B